MSTCDVQELLTQGKCFACIPQGQRKIVGLALLARIAGCGTDCFTIELSSTPDDTTCNGSATVTVTGGTGPFTYLWSNGSTLDTAIGLCAGTYSVVVIDTETACAVTGEVVVESAIPGPLIYSGGALDPQAASWTVIGGSVAQLGNNVYAIGSITDIIISGIPLDGTFDLSPLSATLASFGFTDPCTIADWVFDGFTALVSINLGSDISPTRSDTTNLTVTNCPNFAFFYVNKATLTNLTISNCPALGSSNGGFLIGTDNQMTSTSVNDLLVYLDGLGGTPPGSNLIDLSGGTNAAPSGAGATAATNLLGLGWNLTTN